MDRNPALLRRASLAAVLLVSLLVIPTVSSAGATARAGHGELRVTTSPTVASQISVGGLARNTSGLTGLELPVGTYDLCFRAVAGYVAPPCEKVAISEDSVTRVTGTFELAGTLAVTTEPVGVGGAVVVDGVERDVGPLRLPIAAGTHELCFSSVAGWQTPPCRMVQVEAGTELSVVGAYTSASEDPPASSPPPPVEAPPPPSGDRTPADPAPPPSKGVSPPGRPGTDVVVPKPAPPAHGFTDIGPNAYFDGAVRWLRAEGITQGVGGAKTFAPQQDVTRAQMAAFLWRLHETPGGQPRHGFKDVAASSYFEPAVRWLRAEGITAGTGRAGELFGPNQPVTRAQMAAFLWRSAGSPQVVGAHGFRDVPADAYYVPALRWLVAHEITAGRGNAWTYAPGQHVTRAQMAAFLHRMASEPAAWEHVSPIPSTVAF